MAYTQWTIGSTTVRNPDRLKDGLKILKEEFKGKSWSLKQQEEFFERLVEREIYSISKEGYKTMTSNRKQEHARKWASVLNQLGFSYAYQSEGKVIITEVGNALLDDEEIESEIYLRQLLKFQKPCPLPKQYGNQFKEVSIIPFTASLTIIYELYKKGFEGLTKEEISIFLNTTLRMEDIAGTVEEIIDYREKRQNIKGNVQKREFYVNTLSNRAKRLFAKDMRERKSKIDELFSKCSKNKWFVNKPESNALLDDIVRGGKGSNTKKAILCKKEIVDSLRRSELPKTIYKIFEDYFIGLKTDTLKDYSDQTVRYLRKGGLFSVKGTKLVVIEEKKDLIEAILEREWKLVSDDEYLDYLWNSKKPYLPSDQTEYLVKEIERLKKQERQLFKRLKVEGIEIIGEKIEKTGNILRLKRQNQDLLKQVIRLKEIEYYYLQGKDDQINDILHYFDLILGRKILGGEAYFPAYLEWNTWRVFLSIDTLKNYPFEARNFEIDEELFPIHHAQGGIADMVFVYEDFCIVGEVTLNRTARQWSTEAEPVPRHVANVQHEIKDKKVFGLFVAPEIDSNTILQFFNNRQHMIGKEMLKLSIIPFTIDQVKDILKTFKAKRFSVKQLKQLFLSLEEEMSKSRQALGWFKKIPLLIDNWQKSL